MYDGQIKTQTYNIKSKSQFDYLINYVLKRKHLINYTGFYSKQHIYINVKDNTIACKPLIIIFDVSNMSNKTYCQYLGVVKSLFN